jgi:hypothetical protein
MKKKGTDVSEEYAASTCHIFEESKFYIWMRFEVIAILKTENVDLLVSNPVLSDRMLIMF